MVTVVWLQAGALWIQRVIFIITAGGALSRLILCLASLYHNFKFKDLGEKCHKSNGEFWIFEKFKWSNMMFFFVILPLNPYGSLKWKHSIFELLCKAFAWSGVSFSWDIWSLRAVGELFSSWCIKMLGLTLNASNWPIKTHYGTHHCPVRGLGLSWWHTQGEWIQGTMS